MLNSRPTGLTAFVFIAGLLVLSGCARADAAGTKDTAGVARNTEAVLPAAQPATGTRHWLGPAYWGNRLQDWRFRDGRFECVTPQGWLGMRTMYDLTREVTDETKSIACSVEIELSKLGGGLSYPGNAAAGMLIGVGRGEMDYRSASIVHDKRGYGAGLFVGVTPGGKAFIVDNERPWTIGGPSVLRDALQRDQWKVTADSSEKNAGPQRAIDGKPGTLWHTEYIKKKSPHPHELVIDMGKTQRFAAMAYLPRQDNESGRVADYEVYATNNKGQWGKALATGKLPNTPDLQVIKLPETSARYVKLVAKSAQRPQPATTVAELYLLRKYAEPAKQPKGKPFERVTLELKSKYLPGSDTGEVLRLPKQLLTVTVKGKDGVISEASRRIDPERLVGSLALVSHPGAKSGKTRPALFAFEDWAIAGDAVTTRPQRANSAILGTQYTLTNKTLKMTAQLMPLGERDPLKAELQVDRGAGWVKAAVADIITPGWTATFRLEDWDDTHDTPYRVVYRLPDGEATHAYTWQGTVRKDPVKKDKIVVAGFTGNHMNSKTAFRGNWDGNPDSEPSNFVLGMYYPHADLTERVEQHRPDLLFFSGDQVYEGGSPTFPDRQNIELDYLYKWYLFVISYRDLMKDIPTVTIPDDHDVYQGNVWGQGGRKSPGRDHDGGYVHPASFVQMVHRTQVAHLPDPTDATPILQGISYYTSDVKWGRVSFAVIADRMFKNGCNGQGLPASGTGRPDHYNNPSFDTEDLDIDGMKLLGDRQLEFLDGWAADWKGVDMKMALSQTVFANMATHHGPGLGHLIADLDSNGWPQTGRNKALGKLRKAFALHLAGDQHLATLVHHGIDQHRDAVWSFCVPSVANFYPRAWAPQIKNPYQVPDAKDFTGDRLDGFKNKVSVYAATNPGRDMGYVPKQLHNGMPGYGIVIVDKPQRTYTAQCWPRYADPTKPEQMYPGWPRTIKQSENYGKKVAGYLNPITVKGVDSFVLRVMDAATGELVYALRVKGDRFKPMVFQNAPHRVVVSVGGKNYTYRDMKIGGGPVTINP